MWAYCIATWVHSNQLRVILPSIEVTRLCWSCAISIATCYPRNTAELHARINRLLRSDHSIIPSTPCGRNCTARLPIAGVNGMLPVAPTSPTSALPTYARRRIRFLSSVGEGCSHLRAPHLRCIDPLAVLIVVHWYPAWNQPVLEQGEPRLAPHATGKSVINGRHRHAPAPAEAVPGGLLCGPGAGAVAVAGCAGFSAGLGRLDSLGRRPASSGPT
jgi:hypothetical protein